jgi:hypothetical protein
VQPLIVRYLLRRSPAQLVYREQGLGLFSTAVSPAATDSSAASGLPIANCPSACNANSLCWSAPRSLLSPFSPEAPSTYPFSQRASACHSAMCCSSQILKARWSGHRRCCPRRRGARGPLSGTCSKSTLPPPFAATFVFAPGQNLTGAEFDPTWPDSPGESSVGFLYMIGGHPLG